MSAQLKHVEIDGFRWSVLYFHAERTTNGRMRVELLLDADDQKVQQHALRKALEPENKSSGLVERALRVKRKMDLDL